MILNQRKEVVKLTRATIRRYILYIGNLINDGEMINNQQSHSLVISAEVAIAPGIEVSSTANISTGEGDIVSGRSFVTPEMCSCIDERHKLRIPLNRLFNAVDDISFQS